MNPNWIPVISGEFSNPLSQLANRISQNQQVEQQNYQNQVAAIDAYNRLAQVQEAQDYNRWLTERQRADSIDVSRANAIAQAQKDQQADQWNKYVFETNRKDISQSEAAKAQAQKEQWGQQLDLQQQQLNAQTSERMQNRRQKELEEIRADLINSARAAGLNVSDEKFNQMLSGLSSGDQNLLTMEREQAKSGVSTAWNAEQNAISEANRALQAKAGYTKDPKTGEMKPNPITSDLYYKIAPTDKALRGFLDSARKYGAQFDANSGRLISGRADPTALWKSSSAAPAAAPTSEEAPIAWQGPQLAGAQPQQSFLGRGFKALGDYATGRMFFGGSRPQAPALQAAPVVVNQPGQAEERGGWVPAVVPQVQTPTNFVRVVSRPAQQPVFNQAAYLKTIPPEETEPVTVPAFRRVETNAPAQFVYGGNGRIVPASTPQPQYASAVPQQFNISRSWTVPETVQYPEVYSELSGGFSPQSVPVTAPTATPSSGPNYPENITPRYSEMLAEDRTRLALERANSFRAAEEQAMREKVAAQNQYADELRRKQSEPDRFSVYANNLVSNVVRKVAAPNWTPPAPPADVGNLVVGKVYNVNGKRLLWTVNGWAAWNSPY